MRCHAFLLATTVASASASVLRGRTAPSLPTNAFPSFTTISLEDAKNGLDLLLDRINLTGHLFDHNNPTTDASTPSTNAYNLAGTATTQDASSCSSNPNMRFEWRSYSASDRLAFVKGIKCLMNTPPSGNFAPATSRYEDLVRIHQLYMPNVHGNAKFLIWHRYYLWTFEQVMRSECGFDRAWPWWDETLDAGRFAQSELFTNPLYFGSLPAAQNGQAVCVTDGEFAGLTCNIGPSTGNSPHCLARAVNENLTKNCNADFVNTCNSRTSYADMESCIELGPHGYGHNGIGAVMSDVAASPSDPIFWMHHTFIDHSFRIWQNADSVRVATINGVDANGDALTLDTMVYMGGIRPDVKVRDILDTLGGVSIGGTPFCYRYN